MKREKGSVTLFALISLLLITATLFTLLEGVRFQEIHRFADMQTDLALEAVFANYNGILWKEYRLLGAEYSQMEDILIEVANGRRGEGANFIRMRPQKIELEGDIRFTDQKGRVFIHNTSAYMQKNLLYETVKELYSQYEAIKDLIHSSEMDKSNIGKALEEIKNHEISEERNSFETAKGEAIKADKVIEGLEMIKNWQEKGILGLMLKDTKILSEAEYDFRNGILKRKLEKGKGGMTTPVDWEERILFQQYLLTYMSHFREKESERALTYELEYLIGEQASDIENMKIVTYKLLGIREAANFAFLLSNPERVAQADMLAGLLAGTTLNPALINLIKVGLLTAWAFVESVLDVRALLAGKKIPLIKSDETWTAELENIGSIFDDFKMAKESKWGISYENYLAILLYFENEQELAMRAMNLQEATVRQKDSEFRMDRLITWANIDVTYLYEPIFPFLEIINIGNGKPYEISTHSNYGYY